MPRAKTFGHQKRRLIRKKTSVCVVSEKCDVSSSKKKIEKSKGYFDYEDNFSAESQSRFVIIDLNMLNDIFNNIAKCRYCDRSFCFDVAENKSSRRGLASSISGTCKYCGSSHGSMTSNSVPAGYEVNLRFVYGMRCIGIGKSAAQTFCALMNLPPPPAKFEKDYIRQFLMRWKLLHHKDVELAKELIQYTIEDRKKAEEDRKKTEEDRKKAEEARLREKELDLELARLHRVNSDNERTDEGYNSLDALVKSVRILTVKVPNRPEVSDKIFSTLEKEVASHISVLAGNDWFRPLELAKENTSRGKCLKPLPNILTRKNPVKSASRVFLSEVKNSKCVCCAEWHPLYKCAVYLKLPVTKRIDLIKANNLCFNCLSTSHRAKDCKSRYVCSNCQKLHHNTIHYTERARDQEAINSTLEPLNTSAPEFIPSAETQNNLLTATSINRKKCVLLSSAICYIKCENGLFPVKAILDSGSTSNFVTKSLYELIGLK
ncbi:uncharacterized protein TNCT_504581 [Trichonephila clavata]|uniref:Mutator-like transposase domain-containing protein n=1 Tax=Trichonephila clavata TaxID=2740835 RepID=A0A8X6GLU4_TRICU|nr:uncharacterized protein TNCT_504581 [Trichonephila clavata]